MNELSHPLPGYLPAPQDNQNLELTQWTEDCVPLALYEEPLVIQQKTDMEKVVGILMLAAPPAAIYTGLKRGGPLGFLTALLGAYAIYDQRKGSCECR